MVALGDVKRWNAGALEDVFQTVRQRQQVLISAGDDFLRAVPVDGWQGKAADEATSAHHALAAQLDHFAAGLSIVNKTIAQAADAIPAVQREIAEAEELAARYGFHVGDDGSIIDVLTNPGPADPRPEDRARVRQQVADALSQALRTATDIDNDLDAVLRRAQGEDFGTGTETTIQGAMADASQESAGEVLTPPPPNGTPSQNAAWWTSLSAAGQAILLRDHPDWLGNLDGLPGTVRSQANMARLPVLRAELQAQADQLQKQLLTPPGSPRDAGRSFRLGEQLRDVQAKLHSLDTVSSVMAKPGDRQLLLLDTSQPRAEAAIAVGNVDTAGNVAVFTPGFTSTVNGDLNDYDNHMQNLQAMSGDITTKYGGAPTATVTWIGYQAPQWDSVLDPSQSVANPAAAEAGGASLARFYDGIGANHELSGAPLHLTALGHSYGSTTTGFALGHDTPVNDAILFGSPGQGAQHLNVPAGHLYDEHDQGDDLVPHLDYTLGPSPYYDPGAAARYHPLSTGDSITDLGPMRATSGHTGYLDDRSTSLYNMAAITTGHPEVAKYASGGSR